MILKRIIPCLDVADGNVVKGINFSSLKYAGNPAALARRYYEEGADELVFLDITATIEKRPILLDVVRTVSREVFIPLTVGGGIDSLETIRLALSAGADKVSINSAALRNPKLIRDAATRFGSQCIVIAIDAKKEENGWKVYTQGGKKATGLDAVEWARKAKQLGCGEILLTSIDRDGKKSGYDLSLIKAVAARVDIPIIASGGAGSLRDIANVLREEYADAALIASLLHYNKTTIKDVKNYLQKSGIGVRG